MIAGGANRRRVFDPWIHICPKSFRFCRRQQQLAMGEVFFDTGAFVFDIDAFVFTRGDIDFADGDIDFADSDIDFADGRFEFARARFDFALGAVLAAFRRIVTPSC